MKPFAFILSTIFLFVCLTGAALSSGRPNVLFLFSDDQRADTIHALGNDLIETPNLDRLVSRGMVFTRAYCMGAQQGAVCVPSRAMLMTGRTLFHIKEDLEGQTTWPEMFAQAGYTTFITGKWHNQAASLLRAFSSGKAIFLGGMGDPYNLPVQDISDPHKLVNQRSSKKHSVEVFADSAVDFVRTQTGEKPFLAYVSFNGPHDPRVAPREYQEKYRAAELPLPPNFLPQHPFNNGELVIRDEELAPWPRTPEVVRQHLADYYSYVTFLDAQIGRILSALEQSGHHENTLIVFSSDHGLAIGSHGLFGKQNLYDHSMHAPLIFAGPGIPQRKRSEALSYLFDIFPTLGELAGIASPKGNEGLSLAPIMAGKATSVRDSIFTAYRNVQRAVRDNRWKLIVYPQINKTELFDLENDPAEMQDLATDRGHAGEVQRLTKRMRQWQKPLGDRQRLTSCNPAPTEFDFSQVKSQKSVRSGK
jgi:arylsulfatase A-like enzyme